MRPLTVTLYVNNGTQDLDTSQSVESRLVEMGRISWELDDQLTKISPSDLTLKIADEDGSVWTWLETQLQTLQSGTSQLFPPWLVVYLAGAPMFSGLVDLASIQRDFSSRLINLSAQDWSQMLANVSLSEVQRDLPRRVGIRGAANLGGGWGGSTMPSAARWKGSGVAFTAGTDIVVGDWITSDRTGVQQFKISSVKTGKYGETWTVADGWDWSLWTGSGNPLSPCVQFQRVASFLESQPGFIARSGVLPGNAIALDTVDGLAPGDTLQAIGGAEVLVSDIDPERNEIISARTISGISEGTKLYLTTASAAYLVNQDAVGLAARVALPYQVDDSRFTPGSLPRALFGWMTTWNPIGPDLLHPSDIEPTADGQIRIIAENGAWKGTVEAGYTPSGVWGERYVDWSTQQTAPPTCVMPDDGPAIAEAAGTRNRVYWAWTWTRETYVSGRLEGQPRSVWGYLPHLVYTPRAINYPTYCIGYDYSQRRRIVISNPNEGFATYSEQRWDGSAWSTGTTGNWPISGFYPCQMVPMIGVPATTGPVSPQGLAMLALVSDGTQYLFHLVWAGALVTLPVDKSVAAGAQLVTTPWGVFLLGPGGYGRITFDGSSLGFSWVAIGDPKSVALIPSTFAALSASDLKCFLRIDYPDPDDQAKVLTETRLLTLSTTPTTGTDPVLFSERVMAGAPKIARMFRDPSTTGRLVGVLGSRLFRVCDEPLRVIERISVESMTGQEALEHLGQYLNAIIVPRELGRVELVSRVQSGAAQDITVDRVSITQTRVSQHFFSVVRVSSSDDELYADATGSVIGGKSLEITNAPTIWTEAACYAMAAHLAGFMGTPRRIEEQTWVWEDTNSAPPWETLQPWSPITVNGGATVWLLAGLDYDLIKGEAKVTLLERV